MLCYHFLLSNVLVVLSTQLHLNLAFLSQPSNTSIKQLESVYVPTRYLTRLGGKVVKGNYTLFLPSRVSARIGKIEEELGQRRQYGLVA